MNFNQMSAQFSPTGADATNATVQGQLNGLLAPSTNNQYINNAVNKSQRLANSRGMQNSSMAAGAGTAAAIDAAMPIAQADAASQHQINMQNMTHGQNLDFMGKEMGMNMQNSLFDSMQNAFNNELVGIAEIMNNSDMTQAQKTAAANLLSGASSDNRTALEAYMKSLPTWASNWGQ